MTKEEWLTLEKSLCFPGSRARLTVDGYKVNLYVEIDKNKLVIAVYVDGKIRFADYLEDTEIRRRFANVSTKRIIPKKKFEKMIKGMSKKACEEARQGNEYRVYSPYFTSFRTLKRTFEKNNKSIEIREENQNEI